jgi:tetratricopeptide (TPR) repeat protein
MAAQLENDKNYAVDTQSFQESLFPHYRRLLKEFRKNSKTFVLFNAVFALLFSLEVLAFVLLFASLSQSTMLAVVIGMLFLTCFSYSVLLFYFKAKRPKQLIALKEEFLKSSRETLAIPKGEVEHHLSIAHALLRLASYLEDFEKQFFPLPEALRQFKPLAEKLSIICHFDDVFELKQILIYAAVDEHLEQIRLSPSDFEVHTSLANTYVTLSKIFENAQSMKRDFLYRLRFKETIEVAGKKAREITSQAIEEFKILEYYAPNDPWVHLQLARSYQELGMPEEEVKAYETILKLRPLDKDALFRLGSLYFEQGKNARGLELYEELKKTNFKKAEELISFYGSYRLYKI